MGFMIDQPADRAGDVAQYLFVDQRQAGNVDDMEKKKRKGK